MKRNLGRIAAAALAAPIFALAVAPAANAATPQASGSESGIIVDVGLSLFLEIGDIVYIDGVAYVYIGDGAFEPA